MAEIGVCMICGHSPGHPWRGKPKECSELAVHEIANGPNRQKALLAWYACLVACSWCNCMVLTNKKLWPQSRQLLRLKLLDPENYDLPAFNYLVNPRAPNRITEEDVEAHSPDFDALSVKDAISSHQLALKAKRVLGTPPAVRSAE